MGSPAGHLPSADMDECHHGGAGVQFGQMRLNTAGSFHCLCKDGFELTSDGKNCIGEYHNGGVCVC